MKTKLLGLVATLAAGALFSVGAQAVTLQTTDFITSPNYFNGFESIESSPNTYYHGILYPTNTPYSEGGITVEYVGTAAGGPGNVPFGVWVAGPSYTHFIGGGIYGWYPNGGGYGYTDVTLTSGRNINAIQFLAGAGIPSFVNGGGGPYASLLQYEVLEHGHVVSSGTVPITTTIGGPMQYVGFSGGGFNEIRLQDQIYPGTAFNPAAYESGAYDSFAAIGTGRPSETPLPSTWLMLLSGFVGLGFISYRGTKKNSAAPSAA